MYNQYLESNKDTVKIRKYLKSLLNTGQAQKVMSEGSMNVYSIYSTPLALIEKTMGQPCGESGSITKYRYTAIGERTSLESFQRLAEINERDNSED